MTKYHIIKISNDDVKGFIDSIVDDPEFLEYIKDDPVAQELVAKIREIKNPIQRQKYETS